MKCVLSASPLNVLSVPPSLTQMVGQIESFQGPANSISFQFSPLLLIQIIAMNVIIPKFKQNQKVSFSEIISKTCSNRLREWGVLHGSSSQSMVNKQVNMNGIQLQLQIFLLPKISIGQLCFKHLHKNDLNLNTNEMVFMSMLNVTMFCFLMFNKCIKCFVHFHFHWI